MLQGPTKLSQPSSLSLLLLLLLSLSLLLPLLLKVLVSLSECTLYRSLARSLAHLHRRESIARMCLFGCGCGCDGGHFTDASGAIYPSPARGDRGARVSTQGAAGPSQAAGGLRGGSREERWLLTAVSFRGSESVFSAPNCVDCVPHLLRRMHYLPTSWFAHSQARSLAHSSEREETTHTYV